MLVCCLCHCVTQILVLFMSLVLLLVDFRWFPCLLLSIPMLGGQQQQSSDVSSDIMTHDSHLAASQAFQETKCLPHVGSSALVLTSLQGARGLGTRALHQTSSTMILGLGCVP